MWRSPPLKPFYFSPSSTELDTSPGWRIIACLGSYCVTISPLANVTERHQRSNSRTARKTLRCLSHWALLMVHPILELWNPVVSYEITCRPALKDKSRRRNRNTVPSSLDQTFSCDCCDWSSLFHISLLIYEYACSRSEPFSSWFLFHKAKLWWRNMINSIKNQCCKVLDIFLVFPFSQDITNPSSLWIWWVSSAHTHTHNID